MSSSQEQGLEEGGDGGGGGDGSGVVAAVVVAVGGGGVGGSGQTSTSSLDLTSDLATRSPTNLQLRLDLDTQQVLIGPFVPSVSPISGTRLVITC